MPAFYEQVLGGAYENHVLPFLWMKGEDRATIRAYLEKIAGADIHEVCLESRPHPDFCGKDWFDDLRFVVDEGKRLGLKFWILDDAHFPTGYANGALKAEGVDPALKKTVLTHTSADIVGPLRRASMSIESVFDPTACYLGAAATQDGKQPDLAFSLEGNKVFFDAPAGVTHVTLFFSSQKTGYRDEYINMVSSDSCRVLIDAVYEPHYRELGEEFGKTILGFFSDEPGFMNEKGAAPDGQLTTDTLIGKEFMALPWSRELKAELARTLGVSDDAALFAQLSHLWDRSNAGAAARHAYMDAATRMYRACFDEQLGAWCRERGFLHIGHVIEDKGNHVRLGQGAGHYFRAIGGQDMAGVDVVINQLVPGIDAGTHSYGRGVWDMEFFNYALCKLGSSAAHIDKLKQGRCMAEVFGAFGWHEGLKEMVWVANHFLARGVNWFVPHAFSMAPFPDPDCPPHFYAHGNNPQFRQFGKLMTYINRMGTLLSGGRAHTPVAVLYHADAAWAGKAMPIENVASVLAKAQVDFDFIPADAFCDAERYELVQADGTFSVNGQEYRCLVVPECEFVGADVARFVAGALVPVVCVNALPQGTYDGEGALQEGFAALDDAAFAKAQVVGLGALADALLGMGLAEVRTSKPQPSLRTYRYTRGNEEYLFVCNESPVSAVKTVLADSDGNALTGASFDVLNETVGEAFDGTLELEPYEARLIVLGAEALASKDAAGNIVELNGAWELSFAAPLEYPQFKEAQQPASLQAAQENSVYFDRCGTFRYETRFELAQDCAPVLDCGELYEMLEVAVDGEPKGARIAPPYRLELGQLKAGAHALTIDVTNTVDKTVTDMFAMTEPSEPSGLFGPVKLLA